MSATSFTSLVARALPLIERMRFDTVDPKEGGRESSSGLPPSIRRGETESHARPTQVENKRVSAWQSSLGGPDAWARRLAWDGMGRNAVIRHVSRGGPGGGSPGEAFGEPVPRVAWASMFASAYGTSPQQTAQSFRALGGDPDRVLDTDDPTPFETLYLPLIRAARNQLADQSGEAYGLITEAAHVSLERALLARLSRICGQALFAAFSVHRSLNDPFGGVFLQGSSLYASFLAEMTSGGLWSFFSQYPVAARLCATATHHWVGAVGAFLRHLEADLSALAATFAPGESLGRVRSIAADISDPHDGGKGVFILQFDSDLRLVYKPRRIDLDAFFSNLLAWANDQDLSVSMRPLQTLARSTHGWIEFAEHKTCTDRDEVDRFYRRCGVLLCLVRSLNGGDFHKENLIACGEQPVLIDMEGVLGPHFRIDKSSVHSDDVGPTTFADHYDESVLKIAMLPSVTVSNGTVVDIGGLQGRQDAETVVHARAWTAVNTDAMNIVKRKASPKAAKNAVRLNGEAVQASAHAEAMVEGFREMYRIVLDRRSELLAPGGRIDALRGKPVRFIFRNTSLYGALLQRCLHPTYLRDGIDRSLQFEVLARVLLDADERPLVWPILQAEIAALEQLDVPLFTVASDDTALRLDDGTVVKGFFDRTAYRVARSRMQAMCLSDLERQCRLIRGALYANRRCSLDGDPVTNDPATNGPATNGPAANGSGTNGIGTNGIGTNGISAYVGPKPLHSSDHNPDSAISAEDDQGRTSNEVSQALQLVRAAADRIAEHAVGGSDDTKAWFGIQYVPQGQRHQMTVASHDLFSGSCGIGLFFAALDRVDPGRGYRDLAASALRPVHQGIPDLIDKALQRRDPVDVGAGTGLGSFVYALARAGSYLKEDNYVDAAARLAQILSPDMTDDWGVISGQAGAVLSLLALHRITGDAAWCDRADLFARDLVTGLSGLPDHLNTQTGVDRDGIGRGFAHGTAGIAYALAELDRHTQRNRYDETITGLLLPSGLTGQHNHTSLGAPDASTVSSTWACGSAGIGLAHLAAMEPLNADSHRACVEVAIEHAERDLLRGDDTLACGALGRSLFLHQAARVLDRPELHRSACQIVQALDGRAPAARFDTGWGIGYTDMSLFQGLAGIGYGILQLNFQEPIASILSWE